MMTSVDTITNIEEKLKQFKVMVKITESWSKTRRNVYYLSLADAIATKVKELKIHENKEKIRRIENNVHQVHQVHQTIADAASEGEQ